MSKIINITCTSDNYLSIADLVPFNDNPRELSDVGYKKLKKSILSLGVFKPFLVWKNGNKLLGGNQRHLVIEDLVNNHGFQVDGQLPVTYIDCDEATARTIVLRDNQSDGDWAYEMLADYMNNLEELGGDLSLTGFSDKERADLEKLIQSPDELRESLEDMAGDTDVDDILKKNFGISFKVPEEDWEFFQDCMAYAKKKTKTEDTWTNVKQLFNELLPSQEEVGEYSQQEEGPVMGTPEVEEIEASNEITDEEPFDLSSEIIIPENEITI